jgi:hypothetical protein
VLGAGHASALKGPIQRGESSDRDGRGVLCVEEHFVPTAKRTSHRCASSSALPVHWYCRSCSSARTSVVTRPNGLTWGG